MKKTYLKWLKESETKDSSIYSKIQKFFLENPKPKDPQIHAFAEREGIEHSKFEEIVYDMLGSFLGAGKAKDFDGTFNSEQIKMGIKVEMEHTTSPFLAERIAKDHLAEIPDYYTRLAKMEKDAGVIHESKRSENDNYLKLSVNDISKIFDKNKLFKIEKYVNFKYKKVKLIGGEITKSLGKNTLTITLTYMTPQLEQWVGVEFKPNIIYAHLFGQDKNIVG